MDFLYSVYLITSFAACLFTFWGYIDSAPSHKKEKQSVISMHRPMKGACDLFSLLLGLFLSSLFVLVFCSDTVKNHFLEFFLTRAFTICVSITFYDIILLMFLPVVRKYFSAEACASLWVLPNWLYMLVTVSYKLPIPKVVIPFGSGLIQILALIWLIGFGLSFLYRIVVHLSFRRQILQDAEPVSEEWILKLWSSIQEKVFSTKKDLAKSKDEESLIAIGPLRPADSPQIPLVCSSAVKTPLTIGIIKKKIVVVLPVRDYSEEDLRLILLHEAGHISGSDCSTKYFMTLCTCIFWFLPLHHLAMKRMAEDLEISCDEAVLRQENEAVRYHYATLLLTKPGDSRGFSSCLSASGQSLKARMEKVLHPQRHNYYLDGLFLGLVAFVLLSTTGYIRLSPEQGMAKDLIIGHEVTIEDLTGDYRNTWIDHYDEIDWEAFSSYLNNLEVSRIYGEIRERSEYESVYCRRDAEDESLSDKSVNLVFYKDLLRVSWSEPYEKKVGNTTYYQLQKIRYYHISDNSWRDILPMD